MSQFEHRAMELTDEKPLVFTALSKHLFCYREFIVKFVLESGGVPLNPFMIFGYFLTDAVPRDLVRSGNNVLVRRADELWIFGPVSNGVLAEIILSKEIAKPIRYFTVKNSNSDTIISEISIDQVEMEDEVKEFRSRLAN